MNSSGFYIACTRHLNTAAGLEQRIHTFPVLSIVAVGGVHRHQKKPAIERNVNKIPQLTVPNKLVAIVVGTKGREMPSESLFSLTRSIFTMATRDEK